MSARAISLLAVVTAALGSVAMAAPTALNPLDNRPDATINLATREGMGLLKGQWRYSDTHIVEIDSKGPGPDLKPSGAPIKTYDYLPKAGGADFDDSQWAVIDPGSLEQRRSTGRLCFNWYRTKVTIPERIGRFEIRRFLGERVPTVIYPPGVRGAPEGVEVDRAIGGNFFTPKWGRSGKPS